MNNGKTEVLTTERNNIEWKSCKKLGRLLKTREEWKRRKTISIAAMGKLSKIWSSKISEKKKVRITVLTCKALCPSDNALGK